MSHELEVRRLETHADVKVALLSEEALLDLRVEGNVAQVVVAVILSVPGCAPMVAVTPRLCSHIEHTDLLVNQAARKIDGMVREVLINFDGMIRSTIQAQDGT